MAALFLGRRKDIKKAASGPITEQVSGEQHNCCSVIGNLQNLKKLQNIFYDGNTWHKQQQISLFVSFSCAVTVLLMRECDIPKLIENQ